MCRPVPEAELFARRAHDRCQGRSERQRASPWELPLDKIPPGGRTRRPYGSVQYYALMFGPYSDPRIGAEIGGIFGRAGERIRAQRERSADREKVGNRPRVEPSDTDQLIDDFEQAIK